MKNYTLIVLFVTTVSVHHTGYTALETPAQPFPEQQIIKAAVVDEREEVWNDIWTLTRENQKSSNTLEKYFVERLKDPIQEDIGRLYLDLDLLNKVQERRLSLRSVHAPSRVHHIATKIIKPKILENKNLWNLRNQLHLLIIKEHFLLKELEGIRQKIAGKKYDLVFAANNAMITALADYMSPAPADRLK